MAEFQLPQLLLLNFHSTHREALTGVPVILKFITRLGIEQGSSNLYGLTPLAACQVRCALEGGGDEPASPRAQ